MKLVIGPMVRQLSVAYFARFQKWPETLRLILRGVPVPPALVNEGVIARAKELREQSVRDSRASGLLPEEEVDSPQSFAEAKERTYYVPDLSRTCGGCGMKTVTDGKCALCGKEKDL